MSSFTSYHSLIDTYPEVQNWNEQIISQIKIEEIQQDERSNLFQFVKQENQDNQRTDYIQKSEIKEEKNDYVIEQDSDRKCEICFEKMTSQQFKYLQCKDIFHKSCLEQYLNYQISIKKFPLNCPNFKCLQPVQYQDIKETLNEQDFQKYEVFQLQSYIDSRQEEPNIVIQSQNSAQQNISSNQNQMNTGQQGPISKNQNSFKPLSQINLNNQNDLQNRSYQNNQKSLLLQNNLVQNNVKINVNSQVQAQNQDESNKSQITNMQLNRESQIQEQVQQMNTAQQKPNYQSQNNFQHLNHINQIIFQPHNTQKQNQNLNVNIHNEIMSNGQHVINNNQIQNIKQTENTNLELNMKQKLNNTNQILNSNQSIHVDNTKIQNQQQNTKQLLSNNQFKFQQDITQQNQIKQQIKQSVQQQLNKKLKSQKSNETFVNNDVDSQKLSSIIQNKKIKKENQYRKLKEYISYLKKKKSDLKKNNQNKQQDQIVSIIDYSKFQSNLDQEYSSFSQDIKQSLEWQSFNNFVSSFAEDQSQTI
ncbi:hypothetical protein ABPG72_006765 [Tetrahymena utriculariae]